MKKLLSIALLCFFWLGMFTASAHAQATPILGIWFYQQQDDVMIVSYNHNHTNVTDEQFGLSYTQAATQGCINQGYPPYYLVRYRQNVDGSWEVWCYVNQMIYYTVSGQQFGQSTIDAAIARAKCIVYQLC